MILRSENFFVKTAVESTGREGTFWGFPWEGAVEGWSRRWEELPDKAFREATEAELPALTTTQGS